MIFGFNTEVVHGATCYHLQSEFRTREALLETSAFVNGQCIGKAATTAPPDADEAANEEALRQQHRAAVSAARDGRLEAWLAGGAALAVDILPQPMPWQAGALHLKLRVTRAGAPVENAQVSIEAGVASTCVTTDANGLASVALPIDEATLAECVIIAAAAVGDERSERRYRIRAAALHELGG